MNARSLLLTLGLFCASTAVAQAQMPPNAPTVTGPSTRVLAIGRLAPGIDRAAMTPVMDKEVRDTLRLYLAGKIEQWYFRTDSPGGVVFILNVTTVNEARTLVETLPFGQARLMEFDFIPLGPFPK